MSDADDTSERAAILARRNRFVTTALAGLAGITGTTLATACPCLKMAAPEPEPSSDSAKDPDAGKDSAPVDTKDDAPPSGTPEPTTPSPPVDTTTG
jgi:hypothetical protein